MEAPKGRGRITPLPPPEPDGASPPVERAPRQWLPAGIALAGLVLFALWLVGTETPASNEPAAGGNQATVAPLVDGSSTATPPSTVLMPTTTGPPALAQMLPWLEGSLVIFSGTADGTFLNVWDASLPAAQSFRLSSANVLTIAPEPQSLSFVAYETGGELANTLYVGGWQRQEPVFVGSRGFAWDPAGSATLMWIGIDQISGESALYRKQVSRPIELVAAMPDESHLAGWTTGGLVMSVAAGPPQTLLDNNGNISVKTPTLTELRDPSGAVLAAVAALPLRSAAQGTIVALGTADAYDAAEIEIPETALVVPDELVVLNATVADGPKFELRAIPIPEVLADGEQIFSSDGRWSLSDDGRWAARTTQAGLPTAVVMRSLLTQAVRVISLKSGGAESTVGFSQDGEWFFTYSSQDNALVVANERGAQFTVPFAETVRFGGVYIRPPR